ncbi:hypothetical protein M408DRAFT_59865 [Serendipita vermifera MAFF 305830]|uniref:Peptide hydrolase n=1 Tax=Serendipita vermifera MAFF 305830 TaxID=933852 RepID=A0A0C3BQK6_SERVB|nr:hypothetical protein M408DRAFT_59865 [Serendipita vermifera MAFF 305830]
MERKPPVQVLWSNQRGAILTISTQDLGLLDFTLPRLWEAVALPNIPLPSPTSDESDSDKRLRKILSKVHFNPDVASILSAISAAQMSFDVRWLTGEASDSPIISRHSFSEDARIAARWLKSKFEDFGAQCSFMDFLEGFTPNVICKYAATPSIGGAPNATAPRVILSAHYDSRGSFGSTRQPGGDDDGSGVTHLLAIARAIYRKKVKFNTDVELVAFAGEEQGLLGSHAYAKQLYEENADVVLMIQADMLAYHSSEEPMQLGLPESIGSPVASELVANISSIYVPELTVGPTAACCSDHQSFWMYGFTSTQVFERAGGIIDPKYHNSGDLSNRTNYDLEQVHAIAKVTLASLLHTAGFTIETETL